MRLPRKGILIRLAIYIPLLSFFGWKAYQRWSATPPPSNESAFDGPRQVFKLPDGKSVEVVQITEEQARQMGLDIDAAKAPAEPAGAAEKKPPEAPAGSN